MGSAVGEAKLSHLGQATIALTEVLASAAGCLDHVSELPCRYLIQQLRQRFLQAGGTVQERTTFVGAETAPDGIVIK